MLEMCVIHQAIVSFTHLSRLDTAGTEQFTAMRELYIRQGQGFLLVFSITNANSFHELLELREQIIRIKDDPSVPIVLVGNKSDLEDDRAVPRARAFQLAQQWGNIPYFEASARRRTNVDEAFAALTQQVVARDMQIDQQAEQEELARGVDRTNRRERRSRRRRTRENCIIL